jgi:hypothetical protein
MAGTQRLLAIAMAFLSMNGSSGGTPEVVGIVAQANHASLGSQAAAEGTTIYDGDRLTTDTDGNLRVLIGGAMVHLAGGSSAILRDAGSNKAGKQFAAELAAGTVTLAVTLTSTGEVVACGARVRPVSETRGVVRVQIVGPRELLVYAQRSAAVVSYREDAETVPEGKAYRVLLNASDDGPATEATKAPGRRRKALVLVAIAIGAATAAGVALALTGRQGAVESPDRP